MNCKINGPHIKALREAQGISRNRLAKFVRRAPGTLSARETRRCERRPARFRTAAQNTNPRTDARPNRPSGVVAPCLEQGINNMKTFDQEFGELSEEQREILAALMAYPTKTAAAKALRISRGALYRYLAEPKLKEAYEQLRAAAIADATDSLQTVAEQAVSVLHEIANDPGVVPNVRVSAASKILDTAIKAHELQDVLTRLEALETEMA